MGEISFTTVDSAHAPTGFKRGDVVKMYKEGTELSFPCIVLSCEKLEMFRVDALKGVLGNKSLLADTEMYNVYVDIQGQPVLVGVLPNTRLRFILSNRVFNVFDKRIHLSKDQTVEGDMLYALCLTKEK